MKRYVKSGVGLWKTKYRVCWISPDGNNCVLGGSNSIEEANEIARRQAQELFESPWETDERKFHFLESMYIAQVDSEKDAMSIETEEYIDNLMSELDSRR